MDLRSMNNHQDFGTDAPTQFTLLGKHLAERKRSPAFPSSAAVWVAEANGEKIPPPYAFREVISRNLTTTDFEFLDKVPPRTERLIVLVTKNKGTLFLLAKVLHHHECNDEAEPMFLIRCNFIERIVTQ
jgi:hypothetical protein